MATTQSLEADSNQDIVGARLMVCMCPQTPAARALHAGARLAEQLRAPWFAVYVMTSPRPWHRERGDQDARTLSQNIELAKSLGASVVKVRAADVSDGLIELATRERITHAIFGRVGRSPNVLAPESVLTKFWHGVSGVEVLLARLEPTEGATKTETASLN